MCPSFDLLPDDTTAAHSQRLQVKFNLLSSTCPENEGCYLSVDQEKCLEDCKFNATAKTFFIIHGWTVSMETSM